MEQLGMLQGVEYIPFDFANPHEGHAQLTAELKRLAKKQVAKEEQRDAAFIVLACLALVLLTLDS